MEVTSAETLNLDRERITGGRIQCIYVILKKQMEDFEVETVVL